MENNYFKKSIPVLNKNIFNKVKKSETFKSYNHNDPFGNELNIIKMQSESEDKNFEIKNELSQKNTKNYPKIKLKPIEKNNNNNLSNNILSNEIKVNSNKKINILNNNIKMNSNSDDNTNKDKTQEEKTNNNLQN